LEQGLLKKTDSGGMAQVNPEFKPQYEEEEEEEEEEEKEAALKGTSRSIRKFAYGLHGRHRVFASQFPSVLASIRSHRQMSSCLMCSEGLLQCHGVCT
jgi:hypothetical protein